MLIGILIGVLLSFKIDKIHYSLIFIICPILVYLYSTNNTKKSFFSNIVTSFLKPFAIITLWWFDSPVNLSKEQWDLLYYLQLITIIYAIISFLSNIVLGIITDIININEDNFNKQNTLPIVLGRKRAKNIALMLSIIVFVFVLSIAIACMENKFILKTIIFLGTLPELYFIYRLMNASELKDYKKLYATGKVLLFLALLSIPIIAYYFKYVIS
ncbi:UbiA prenyltransferase family protein [Tenacibaculum tangerinum]